MSHFSTVKTELRQLEPLVKALEDLGYAPEQGEKPVRGYRGQVATADLAVVVDSGFSPIYCPSCRTSVG